jgi:putative FmdB family regulatory protein
MPIREYQCEACGRRFEKLQKLSDPPVEVCLHCGRGPVHKVMSSPAIQFKGSGWYVTDYAKKDTGGGKKSDESSSDSPAKESSSQESASSDKESGKKTESTTATTDKNAKP